MKGLFVKDLCILKEFRKMLWIILIFTVAMLVMNDPTTERYAFIIFYIAIMSAMIPTNMIAYDDDSHGMSFLMTLPITRKQYACEKYALSILVAIAGCFFGCLVSVAVFLVRQAEIPRMEFLVLTVVAMLAALFMTALLLPIKLKYAEKGNTMVIVVCFALFAITYILTEFGRKLNIDFSGAARFLDAHTALAVAAAVAVVLLVLALSLNISIGIMKKKEY